MVIDQREVFLGGIDLAFGRRDDHHHLVKDNKMPNITSAIAKICKESGRPGLGHGPGYRRWDREDIYNPFREGEAQCYCTEAPRMPWHDVQVGVCGEVAQDFTRHFIERWNYARCGLRLLKS